LWYFALAFLSVVGLSLLASFCFALYRLFDSLPQLQFINVAAPCLLLGGLPGAVHRFYKEIEGVVQRIVGR
jgi:hypothetical protein